MQRINLPNESKSCFSSTEALAIPGANYAGA